MLIFISVLLCCIPIILIFYPLINKTVTTSNQDVVDESFQRRWDSIVDGLQNAELEFSIGTINKEDYKWLQKTYAKEAVEAIKEFKMSVLEEKELIQEINQEIAKLKNQYE